MVLVGSTVAFTNRSQGGTDTLETDPNVLLITVDGLRSDYASFEGAEALKPLMEDGVQFLNVLVH